MHMPAFGHMDIRSCCKTLRAGCRLEMGRSMLDVPVFSTHPTTPDLCHAGKSTILLKVESLSS